MKALRNFLAVEAIRLAFVSLSPILLLTARTGRGRWIGILTGSVAMAVTWISLAYITMELLPLPPMGRVLPPDSIKAALFLLEMSGFWFSVLVAIVTFLTLLIRRPLYYSDAVDGWTSHFLGPVWLTRVQHVWFPEADWVWLGVQLVTRLDPWMSRSQARLMRDVVREALDEIAETPGCLQLPSALPLLFWGSFRRPDHGHFYSYIPSHQPGETLSLFVVLHGHGGNFLLWPHSWKEFADEQRCIIVSPSFGYGNWEHPQGVNAVERCLNFAETHFPIDPTRVHLAGISQGGCGVARSGAVFGSRLAGLIFLSPTMEPAVLNSHDFVETCAGRPILVVQGSRDHNVKPQTVDAAVQILKQNGADVTYHTDPDADHFLYFAKRDEIHTIIGDWVKRTVNS